MKVEEEERKGRKKKKKIFFFFFCFVRLAFNFHGIFPLVELSLNHFEGRITINSLKITIKLSFFFLSFFLLNTLNFAINNY